MPDRAPSIRLRVEEEEHTKGTEGHVLCCTWWLDRDQEGLEPLMLRGMCNRTTRADPTVSNNMRNTNKMEAKLSFLWAM